ncbi:hypothetical protein HID58_041972 [Brassica napus]|uniref:Uncharacterized protein n=1 Tax=Brassica napus TaxID=3708 RepID=A0ABQ8BCE4_BRANA|nr:hypothetical protein HID58_041972 [Brassica napus]
MVFDFSRVQAEVAPDISESSSRGPLRQKVAIEKGGASGEVEKGHSEGFGEDQREEGLLLLRNQQTRSGRNISTERQTRSRNSQSSRSSWARRNQNKRKSVPTGSDNGLSEKSEGKDQSQNVFSRVAVSFQSGRGQQT